MDLGFLCEECVHCCYLGVKNYLLFCCIIVHESMSDEEVFYVDDNYAFKKEQKIED
jgi:hypothetical protein